MIWKTILKSHSVLNCIKINLSLKENLRKHWPRRDSNPQSSDPKSDAISIRPRGRRSKRRLSLTQIVLKIEKVYMLGKSDIPLDRIPAANSICSHVSSGIIAGSGAGKVRKFNDLHTIFVRSLSKFDRRTVSSRRSLIMMEDLQSYTLPSTIVPYLLIIRNSGHRFYSERSY